MGLGDNFGVYKDRVCKDYIGTYGWGVMRCIWE